MAYFPELVTLDPATPASAVHTFNGNVVFGTIPVTSFSSATMRYFGNKIASMQVKLGNASTAGSMNLYSNCYFDGTNNRFTIANETAVNLSIAGNTTATSLVYALNANNNVSHAADATFTFSTLHSISASGLHTIGLSSSNDTLVHQLHGSLNTLGAVIPSFSSTRYRYIGSKLSSEYFDNGSGAAAGQLLSYGNAYFDGTNSRRSRASETCANVVLAGQTAATSNVWTVQADPSVAGAADSVASLAAIHAIDANGMHYIGNSSTNNSLVHQLYGSMSLLGAVIPSFSSTTQRYIGTKLSSGLFITGSNGSAGSFNLFANMYNDGTSAKYGRANETCVNLFMRGATAATTTVYILAADPSVSHAADVAATVVNLHSIDANGLHSIGNSTTNNALVHNIYGSMANGTVIPSFSSSSLRYYGAKPSSFVNTITGTGSSFIYSNCYGDGTGDKRSAGTQNSSKLTLAGNSSNILTLQYDAGGTVDTSVSFTTFLNITSAGNYTFGASGTSTSHTFNGLINADTSTVHAFYSSVAGTSSVPFRISRNTTGANNVFLACATGGTSASSPGTDQGGIRINAANTALEFFWSSDSRLKDNIREYTGCSEKVKNLKPRLYDWKDKTLPQDCVGFIAQEMQKVVPEAVCVGRTEADGTEILAIGTQSLIPYLWGAVGELLERIEKLESASKKKTKKDEE